MFPSWFPLLGIQCTSAVLGGITTTTLINPLDIIRARLQVSSSSVVVIVVLLEVVSSKIISQFLTPFLNLLLRTCLVIQLILRDYFSTLY